MATDNTAQAVSGHSHDPIRRVLRDAARRLAINAWLRALVVALTAAAIGALLAVGAQKLTPVRPDWAIFSLALIAAASLGAGAWAMATRPRGVRLAEEVDRRAGLRETLSTAMVVAGRSDGWSRAVVDSAGERARRVVVRDAVPITPPQRWWTPGAVAAVAAAAMLLPSHDLTGALAEREQQDREEQQAVAVRERIEKNRDELERVLERAGVEQPEEGDEDATAADLNERIERPEEAKRSEIARLTKLRDELQTQAESERAKRMNELRRSLSRMRSPDGQAQDFGRKLARGDFEGAKRALEELAEKTRSSEMPAEERRAVVEQLEELKDQLERLAEAQAEAKEQLKKAGLTEEQIAQAAGDPEALQEALEEAGMSKEQARQLAQQAAAQQNAQEAMQGVASAIGQMAQGVQQMAQGSGQQGTPQQGQQGGQQGGQPGSGQMMQGLGDAAGRLGQLADMQGRMQALQEAMDMARAQIAGLNGRGFQNAGGSSIEWRQGPSGESSTASKGIGEGGSGAANKAKNESFGLFNLTPDQAEMRLREGGPIIASQMVFGQQIRGESREGFAEAVRASSVEAGDAVESMRVPRELHDAVRNYFGRLERIAGEEDAGGDPDGAPGNGAGEPSGEGAGGADGNG